MSHGLIDGGSTATLTSGRVVYVGNGGILQDDPDLTYDGSRLSLAVQGVSGGLILGGDASLYRHASDLLGTEDQLIIRPASSSTYISDAGHSFGLRLENTSPTNNNVVGVSFTPNSNLGTSAGIHAIFKNRTSLETDIAFQAHSGGGYGEVMRLTGSSAQLLLGYTTPQSNGRLQVNGNIGVGDNGTFYIRPATSSDNVNLIYYGQRAIIGSSNANAYNYSGGALLASLSNADGAKVLDVGAVTESNSGRIKIVVGASGTNVSLDGYHSTGQFMSLIGNGDAFLYPTGKLTLGAGSTGMLALFHGGNHYFNFKVHASNTGTPASGDFMSNDSIVISKASNTQVRISLKGSDGVVRTGIFTVA